MGGPFMPLKHIQEYHPMQERFYPASGRERELLSKAWDLKLQVHLGCVISFLVDIMELFDLSQFG
jgi:hypothetical protein